LKQSLGIAHISTGDMLRERVASGDALGKAVESLMQSGTLVPDDTVNRLVEDRIEEPDCARGFILDGYPRTVDQALLLEMLLAAKGIRPLTVHLVVDYNVIIARLSGRRQCPTCGNLYSLSSASQTISENCDYDGTKLIVRDDDREEVVRERLRAYERQTVPVLETLKNAGYPYWEVAGADAPAHVIARRIESLVRRGAGEAA